ncbi:MAG: stage V sporulation protein SpoVM [Ruminococcaceae bacterium]|nr:stage V sporulation protein SpoVM [Oscillospiraceae bacterium]
MQNSFSKSVTILRGRIFHRTFCKVSSVFYNFNASFSCGRRNMPISLSLTEVFFMKIVVVKSPKFFTPFLRMIFKIGREDI